MNRIYSTFILLILVAGVLFESSVASAQTQIPLNFQAIIKRKMSDGSKTLVSQTGVQVGARIVSYSTDLSKYCVLRHEVFSNIAVTQGALRLPLGVSSVGRGPDITQGADQPVARSGVADLLAQSLPIQNALNPDASFLPGFDYKCYNVLTGASFAGTSADLTSNRRVLVSMTLSGSPVVGVFNVGSQGYTALAASLNGFNSSDFLKLQLNGSSVLRTQNLFNQIYDQFEGIAASPCATGMLLKFNGTQWACTADSALTAISALTGDVTATGPGAAAATISASAVNTSKIADSAVTFAKMQPLAAQRILGRVGPGTGVASELAVTGSGGISVSFSGSGLQIQGSGGTVTSVSSSNSYVTVASGGTTPVITAVVGSGAGTLAAGDDSRIINAVSRTGDTMTGSLNVPSNGLRVGTNDLVLTSTGMGVGVALPMSRLQVAGAVQISDDAGSCVVAKAGAIKYVSGGLLFCNGSTWTTLATGSTAISSVNGLTSASQAFSTGNAGLDFNVVSTGSTHTFNIPLASTSSVTAGLLSNSDYQAFSAKQPAGNYITQLTGDVVATGPGSAVSVISNNAITEAKILDSAVTATKIANGSVGTDKLIDSSVTTAKVASGNITLNKIQDIATQKVLGRSVAGSGTVEELSIVGSGGISVAFGSGNITIQGSGGTVTSVSSANALITVTSGTTTPLITAVTGTGANTLAVGNDSRIVNAVNRTGDTMTGTLNVPSNGLLVGTNDLIFTSTGVGMGVSAPASRLQVNGAVQVGNDVTACTAGKAGAIRYTAGFAYLCNGSSWVAMTQGISAIASLNGSSVTSQSFAVGSAGTGFGISSDVGAGTHTFNLPNSSVGGVVSGYLSNADYQVFSAKLGTASVFSGDVSGVYNNIVVDRIKGRAVSATAPVDGQLLLQTAGVWTPVYVGLGQLRTAIGGSQFASATCAANQTLTWSAITDAVSCVNIANLDAATLTSGVIANARLPASATYWQGTGGVISYTGGFVGIGTAAPSGILDVQGGTAGAGVAGRSVRLVAQNGGTGNAAGGDILLVPGNKSGTGAVGSVDVNGHLSFSGGTPTINNCGIGATVAGTDSRGTLTTSSVGAVDTCSINFAVPFKTAPFCVVSQSGNGPVNVGISVAATATTMTVYLTSAQTSRPINYQCLQ